MGDELVRLAGDLPVNQDVGAGGKTRCSLRIQVLGAPKPTSVGLPMFVDIGQPEEKT
jgi:hypothetical protein